MMEIRKNLNKCANLKSTAKINYERVSVMDISCVKCPNCGGQLVTTDDGRAKRCEYCDNIYQVDVNSQQQDSTTYTYSVKLNSFTNAIGAIKTYRGTINNDMYEAKAAIDRCPTTIVKGISEAEANDIANSFRKAGCVVEVVKHAM